MQGRKSLGYFITARRKRMGLTQAELAHMMGVSKYLLHNKNTKSCR